MGAFMRGGPGSSDPGRVMYHGTFWTVLMPRAFGVQPDQVKYLGWMTNGGYFYDVDATMPPDTTEQQFRMMLRDLLVTRFHLVYHVGRKSVPGYELTAAPGGAKLQRSTAAASCPDESTVARGTTDKEEEAVGEFPVLKPGQTFMVKRGRLAEPGIIRMTFHGTITEFVEGLPFMIMESNHEDGFPRYRVMDRTGLEGVYCFRVEYFGSVGGPVEAGGPSVFQALERQLGLKLNKTKDVKVDLIVVDSAEENPTEN